MARRLGDANIQRHEGNDAFRQERERRRWSREALADWATDLAGRRGYNETFTGEQIRRIEVNGVVPEPQRQEVLCALFDLSSERLGFPVAPAALASHTVACLPPRFGAGLLTVRGLDPVDSDEMRRREFARILALVAGGAVASHLDLERLAAVLAGSRPDGAALDGLEALTADLIRREATLAPQALLPDVHGHLQGLQDVLAWTPPSLTARAHSLAGQTALLAGYLMFKMNRPAEADTYWSAGDHFGDIAGDLKLRGIILQLQSWRWEDENPSLSLTLLNHAETLLGSRPEPASAALLLTRRALRYAETSHLDRTHAALATQDVSNAQKYLSSIAPGDSLYIFEGVADEAITMRALSLLELNRPQEAAADLERIYTSIPSESLSWRAYIAADLAAVRVRLDDPEGASDMLGHALQMAAQAHALRVVQWVRTCRQRWLAGCDSHPAVRRLDEQIHALPSPTVASLPA